VLDTEWVLPVTDRSVVASVIQLTGPLCDAEGIELVHVEYQRETVGRVLRLYIDQPGGVTLDDCTRISRQLGDLLDVSLEDMGPYHLEISSPGIDRPLGKKQDFERFKGKMAKLKTIKPVAGKKNFTGTLSGLREGFVEIRAGDKTVAISFDEIIRARLVNNNGES
jgi:ribosome maturation factor RimP